MIFFIGMVMIAQARVLPVISVVVSAICIGGNINVTTNSSNTQFEWLAYSTLPTNPLASSSTRSLVWNATNSGNARYQ